MECYVCRSEATGAGLDRQVQVDCPLCGSYRISRAAIQLFEDGAVIDVESTRRWIMSYAGSDKLPMLATQLVRMRRR